MKAYIIRRKGHLSPFGVEKTASLLGNIKLIDFMLKVFSSLKIETVKVSSESDIDDSAEHIIIGDNVFCTEKLLREFINISRRLGCVTRLNLSEKDLLAVRTVCSVQNVICEYGLVGYDLYFFPEKISDKRLQNANVEYPASEKERLSFPSHMCKDGFYEIPVTEEIVVQIDHWANLWSANILVTLSKLAELKGSFGKKIFYALKAGSFNKWKVVSKFNDIGSSCDIHPTACIEASKIGNNVKIGAGVIIRASIIGDGTTIDDGVHVVASVIGEESRIYRGKIIFSVLYPESFSSTGLITTSLLGHRTFVGSGALITDFRLDGKNVTIKKDGAPVDSGNRFIGACLGHDVSLGSGCIIAPGREIPNGSKLVPSSNIFSSEEDISSCSIG